MMVIRTFPLTAVLLEDSQRQSDPKRLPMTMTGTIKVRDSKMTVGGHLIAEPPWDFVALSHLGAKC